MSQIMSEKISDQNAEFLLHVMDGMTLTEAAKATGFAPQRARYMGSVIMKKLRERMAFDLEYSGLTNHAIIEKYLKPALEATTTKFGFNRGVVMDERTVIDWGARLQALDVLCKLKGSYPARRQGDESDEDATITVNIVTVGDGGNVQING
jgi:hypothetical protein